MEKCEYCGFEMEGPPGVVSLHHSEEECREAQIQEWAGFRKEAAKEGFLTPWELLDLYLTRTERLQALENLCYDLSRDYQKLVDTERAMQEAKASGELGAIVTSPENQPNQFGIEMRKEKTMNAKQVEQAIDRAYARYDGDKRVHGPEDMDAFRDALRPMVGILLGDALNLPTLPPGDRWVLKSELDAALLRLNVADLTDYAEIRVPTYCIPVGARLVEAYETPTEVILCGEPPDMDTPEGQAHNCDALGCTSVSHVRYRFQK